MLAFPSQHQQSRNVYRRSRKPRLVTIKEDEVLEVVAPKCALWKPPVAPQQNPAVPPKMARTARSPRGQMLKPSQADLLKELLAGSEPDTYDPFNKLRVPCPYGAIGDGRPQDGAYDGDESAIGTQPVSRFSTFSEAGDKVEGGEQALVLPEEPCVLTRSPLQELSANMPVGATNTTKERPIVAIPLPPPRWSAPKRAPIPLPKPKGAISRPKDLMVTQTITGGKKATTAKLSPLAETFVPQRLLTSSDPAAHETESMKSVSVTDDMAVEGDLLGNRAVSLDEQPASAAVIIASKVAETKRAQGAQATKFSGEAVRELKKWKVRPDSPQALLDAKVKAMISASPAPTIAERAVNVRTGDVDDRPERKFADVAKASPPVIAMAKPPMQILGRKH